MSSRPSRRRPTERGGRGRSDPWLVAAAASVALSLITFATRDRETGIFVGLWAPTILAFGSYIEQRRTTDRLRRAREESGVIDRVEKIVQG